MVDVHSHIVYGVDDGAETIDQALDMIKERYGNTYFPKTQVDIPNETTFNTGESKPKEINITRNTKLSELIIK